MACECEWKPGGYHHRTTGPLRVRFVVGGDVGEGEILGLYRKEEER